MQMQPNSRSRPTRRSPRHAWHCSQDRAIHRRQRGQRLAHAHVPTLAVTLVLPGQLAHDLLQNLRLEHMLCLRKYRRRNRGRTDRAHFLRMAEMTERAQTGHHRVEHRKKKTAKIILSQEGAPTVLFARRTGFVFEQGQHPLAKLVQEIPVSQLVFSNLLTLLAHPASTPEGVLSYKLQLCYKNIDRQYPPVLQRKQTRLRASASRLPNTTANLQQFFSYNHFGNALECIAVHWAERTRDANRAKRSGLF